MIKQIIPLLLSLLLAACTTTQTSVYWISGMRPECPPNEGKTDCIQISKGESLEYAKWETFSTPIQNFKFEEGYLQKIEVIEKTSYPKNATIKISTKTYVMSQVLERIKDVRILLNGTWLPNRIKGESVLENDSHPELTIDLKTMELYGTDGCNRIFGPIQTITLSDFVPGMMAGTKMMCIGMQIPDLFNAALRDVKTYKVEGDNLAFYGSDGAELISFFKKVAPEAGHDSQDHWAAVRINGNSIETMSSVPRMNLDLEESMIYGNDGCNEFSVRIEKINDGELELGMIRSTKKFCPDMKNSDQFHHAMQKAKQYKLEKRTLILYDINGKELITFMKVD